MKRAPLTRGFSYKHGATTPRLVKAAPAAVTYLTYDPRECDVHKPFSTRLRERRIAGRTPREAFISVFTPFADRVRVARDVRLVHERHVACHTGEPCPCAGCALGLTRV